MLGSLFVTLSGWSPKGSRQSPAARGLGRAVWLAAALLHMYPCAAVQARSPAPGLSWAREAGAESCITSVDLAKKVENLLRRAVFVSASEAELIIEGYARPRKGGGFEAKLMVVDASGKKLGSRDLAIERGDCSVLDEALALVIAVTINPQSGLAGESMLTPEMAATLDALFSKESGEPELEAQTVPAANPRAKLFEEYMPPAEPPGSAPRSDTPYRGQRSKSSRAKPPVYISAGGIMGAGLLPGIAPGVGAEVAYAADKSFRLAVSGAMWFPTEAEAPGDSDGKGRFRLFYAGPSVCSLVLTRGVHSLWGCGGIVAGAIQANTADFRVENRKINQFIVNALAEARLRWNLSEYVCPQLGVAAALPLLQHAFTFQDSAGSGVELFRMAQIGLSAELALEATF